MATIYDVNPQELIRRAAEELKKVKEVKMPDWAAFVKTGPGKERPPKDLEWWHYRAAAILRKVYVLGPVGVNKLRRKFRTKKDRGHKPEKVYPASGKIIRTILQQLTREGLVEDKEKGVHKGKVVTAKGKAFLDKLVKVKK